MRIVTLTESEAALVLARVRDAKVGAAVTAKIEAAPAYCSTCLADYRHNVEAIAQLWEGFYTDEGLAARVREVLDTNTDPPTFDLQIESAAGDLSTWTVDQLVGKTITATLTGVPAS